VIERAVALAETDSIELDDLPPQVRGEFTEVLWPSLERGDSLRSWGTRYAQLVFERCGRNKRTACRVLDISYHTLRSYLRPTSKRPRSAPAFNNDVPSPEWVQSTSDAASGSDPAGEDS
jgi:transcriptional regulator with AAA-type ATPase domain